MSTLSVRPEEARKQWLAVLKPGDDVIVRGYGFGARKLMRSQVVRTSKTLAILRDGSRFRLRDGVRQGEGFAPAIEPADSHWGILCGEQECRERLEQECRGKLNTAEIAVMLEALDRFRGAAKEESQ